MKPILILLLLFSSNLFALEYNKKYSLETYTFLRQPALETSFRQQYFLQKKDATDYTKVFVKINEHYSAELLSSFLCKEILRTQSVALLSVPVANIPHLAEFAFIEQIEIATQALPLLDSSLYYTHTDLVHQGVGLERSYTGAGVIVGVVDYGFDFTHPMFSDKDGNSRVTRAWVPLDETGTPPAFSEQGTLYTNSHYIKNTLKYTSRDNYHGSHVLGIVAGSRVRTLNTRMSYEGVASSAEIAVVECAGITINEALHYLLSYADSVGKPLVVNMSLGSIGGPCDGKELRDLNISEMLNSSPGGRILVASAGNSGNSLLHIGHKFEDESKSINVYQEFKPAEGNPDYNLAYFEVWGEPGDEFIIDVEMCNNFEDVAQHWEEVITIKTTDEAEASGWMDFESDDIHADVLVTLYSGQSYAGNDRPYVQVLFQDHSYAGSQLAMYPWVVRYKITSLNGTRAGIHCWNMLRYNGLWSEAVEADPYYSIGSPGTVPEVITVGAYVTRDWLHTVVGGHWPNSSGRLNEIAIFSSLGPLLDNTIKPDITAPGSLTYSAYNSFDTISAPTKLGSTVDYVEDASTNNKHVIYYANGTSMSSPVVAGVVALMLEKNSQLTSSEIKDILRVTAINDAWTGNAKEKKSVRWGWGKINALNIMKELEIPGSDVAVEPDFDLKIYPNPVVANWLYIDADNMTGMPFVINIYNTAGDLVYLSSMQSTKQIDLSSLPAGNYFIEVANHKASVLQKFVK